MRKREKVSRTEVFLRLHDVSKWSYKKIADLMGMSKGRVEQLCTSQRYWNKYDEEHPVEKKKQLYGKAAWGLPIDDLALRVRAWNGIHHFAEKVGIKTLGELIQYSEIDLLESARNLGPDSVREIVRELRRIKLRLRDDDKMYCPECHKLIDKPRKIRR